MTALAFLGTGIMGAPMARNLAAAGFDVTVFNRTRAKAEPLADDGIAVADSIAEAARGCRSARDDAADGRRGGQRRP